MSSELMRHNGMEEDPEGAFVYQDDANRIIKKLEERLKDIPCKRYVAADKLCESVAELQIQNEALEEHVKKLKGDLAEEELPALEEALHDRCVLIEELENPWISVDTEIPDEWDDNIVITDGSGWRELGNMYEDYSEIVTHWMPIPSLEEQSNG